MAPKTKKRAAPAPANSSKKRKVQLDKDSKLRRKNAPQHKDKASDRKTIDIPNIGEDNEASDLSDVDVGLLQEYGGAAHFLGSLDHKAIARSKKETERLHRLHKPVREARVDDLPSVHSHDEEECSDIGSLDASLSSDSTTNSDEPVAQNQYQGFNEFDSESDAEMAYERIPRKRGPSMETRHIPGLPIKLSDGRIQATNKVITTPLHPDTEDDESEVDKPSWHDATPVKDVTTGARFGRLAIMDVISIKPRTARVQGAKEQIASICQEILANPENSLGLLRRLHTFSLEKITSPSNPEPVTNDLVIRKLAIFSQLMVFKDIIPGYCIRALTEKEKAEKVGQMVARTREWEQGLVLAYQSYLRILEEALKAKSELSGIALKCMCTLVTDVTHFNFRVNLMTCIVATLSKKSWDESSDLCLNTLISIFRSDMTGMPSLEIVQLLNRMIKERHFNVHPEVLACLLYLRLKNELSVRASDTKVDGFQKAKVNAQDKGAKGRSRDRHYLSKRMRKALKERKEIQREVREAEAEVDKEERAKTHTETLKLLFVLYFRILKNPHPTRLLPAALRGISKFAHLVNVDFFKDLMQVLRNLITRDSDGEDDFDSPDSHSSDYALDVQHRLLCIVTAFELLSGQGEALNIDLSDFINHLYAIILPVSLLPQIDVPLPTQFISKFRTTRSPAIADMLFGALMVVFAPRTLGGPSMPWRSAAFAKRLLIASINWPPSVTLRALEFIETLLAKDPKLEALLSTEDRTADGVYLPMVDDPQLSQPFGTSFFELLLFQQCHFDSRIREAAKRLCSYTRT